MSALLADLGDFAGFNEICAHHFEAPCPTRLTVCVPLVGFLIEVEAIARRPISVVNPA